MITKAQLEKILKIIAEHKDAMVLLTVGNRFITPERIAELKRKGVIARDVSADLIKSAYLYGLLAQKSASVEAEALIKEIKGHIPGKVQKGAIEWLEENAAQHIKGLGNKIEDKTWHIIHDAEKEEAMRGIYRETLVQGAKDGLTRSQMVTALREATGEVTRDMQRVANTELHNAQTQGVASYIRDTFGEDAYCFVRPAPTACPTCKKAYLGADGNPKVFKLSEISAKTNVGRKKDELIADPGLPCLHPHCACQLFRINPATQEFNEHGQVVYKGAA